MNAENLEFITQTYDGLIAYGLSKQETISTGIPQLDAITGGGIPRGRIVEIHGDADSGKTALALHLARQLPGPMLYVDADHGLSPYILSGAEGYLLDAGTMENTLDACAAAARNGAFGSIVIDTVAALPTNEDMNNRFTDGFWGQCERQAKIMSKALPILAGPLRRTGCTLILVNQLRERSCVMFGNPDRPPGGKAVGYYAALRLRTDRILGAGTVDRGTGQGVRVTVTKCKYAPPGRQAEIRLIYGEGVRP